MDKRAREDLRELDRIPFEDQVSPLMFDRRIEGVLRPDKMPSVLQGDFVRLSFVNTLLNSLRG